VARATPYNRGNVNTGNINRSNVNSGNRNTNVGRANVGNTVNINTGGNTTATCLHSNHLRCSFTMSSTLSLHVTIIVAIALGEA
jgi:hypothetical protein